MLTEEEREKFEARKKEMMEHEYMIANDSSLPIDLTEKRIQQAKDSLPILRENYNKIISIFKEYMDMSEDYIILTSTYVIATYFFKEFETFPILFVNAMRGGGKTRFDRIMKYLCWNGKLITSLKEAPLFRTAGKATMIIDEFESVGKKGEENLNDLLNTCYKKGLKVPRMKKVKNLFGEEQVLEEFETFTPVIISNIWGMQEMLGDRCIPVILEKSNNQQIINKVEDFETNLIIKQIVANFSLILVYMCSYFGQKHIAPLWNQWINDKYTTLTTHTTYTTYTTLTTPNSNDLLLQEMFLKIDNSGIGGRNLELFLPLILISKLLGDDVFEKFIEIAKKIVESKKIEELTESKDVQVYEFISKQTPNEFYNINQLVNIFRNFVGDDGQEFPWLNNRWFGRALKRLNLIIQKRRIGEGIQVILDIEKAKEKIKMFK